ncbi:ribonuclease H-like domain-containing protein [Rhizophagus clarus]|uniref:Ribonuclease H-like domain-containing protein n=1 Tax=Rhizophagus clarus TaxID=94130 RepID=A0A8H3QEW6_9GLOM|nr:ribonuclease H-like domain-containing protein [Rhizophagus clarus]
MNKIEDFDKEAGIDEIVKQAACNAIEKLKKYYQYTDGMIYTISTILNLRLKLTYHRDHNCEEKYITETRDDIKNLYNTIYAPRLDQNIQNEDLTADDNLLSHIYKKRCTLKNKSELDLYLRSPVVPGEIDLLQWWKANESQYPHLAAMACDYLAIPATSIPIKRAFSGGTNLISQKRYSFSSKTIRACMCLKS